MLCVVFKNNPRYQIGTWFQCFDHGCQVVEVESVKNRLRIKKEVGGIFPFDDIDELVKRPRKRGLDRRGEDARITKESDRIWVPGSGQEDC